LAAGDDNESEGESEEHALVSPHIKQGEEEAPSGIMAPFFFKEVRTATPQWRVLLIFGIGAALAATPVYMHAQGGATRTDAYAEAKKKTRDDKLRWMHSDEMPSK